MKMNIREEGKKILRTKIQRLENGKPWCLESMKRTEEFFCSKFLAKFLISDG